MNISIVIPSRNNLKYLRQAYESIREQEKNIEIVFLDDASTDGTWDWLQAINKEDLNVQLYRNEGPERVGHTVLYDKGVELCSNEVFSIFHADMVMADGYVANMLKYLKPGTVVSATRIEPPLHPPGPEKIILDLGTEPEMFNREAFKKATIEYSKQFKDQTTQGIFAPWIMYKEDFIKIGGHDKLFAPMELEDSDIFNRMLLAGYELVQARDAFVYHMTCRGSRFKDGIEIESRIKLESGQVWNKPKDSEEYTQLRKIKFREWWRKWKTNVLHNEEMLPFVAPRYNTAFVIANCPQDLIPLLEPWCDEMWVDCPYEEYVVKEQPNTLFDLTSKFHSIEEGLPTTNIVILFDGTSFSPRHYTDFIQNIPFIIEQTSQVGVFNWDRFIIRINKVASISMTSPWFKNVF